MEPKISVIIPVYNTEKYVERCLNSILQQSYKNLEIIIVNDASPGKIETIANSFRDRDRRIKYCSHDINMGLFKARLTGLEAATGDYIAFIDSDDYISYDFYRLLVNKAMEKKADIVIGKTVHEREDGSRYIYNLHDASFNFDEIIGEKVQEKYYEQECTCYSWHTVWNKLYTRELWEKCIPFLKKLNKHIIMTEDIAFSTVLFYFAKKITTVENEAYFYCENQGASTNVAEISLSKAKKNIQDINDVITFVENFLAEVEADNYIINHFLNVRKMYSRIWRNIEEKFNGNEKREVQHALNTLCMGCTEKSNKDDFFFESVTTEWNGALEYNKELVGKGKEEYISFDVFDTVIMRPLYNPADLFELMDSYFKDIYACNIQFKQLRIDSEKYCRQEFGRLRPGYQDITLTEIYEFMSKKYNIPYEIAMNLMAEEVRLELEFCTVRNAGKELYEVAVASGKKVIFISDMYLEEEILEKILKKNGYKQYEKLFVSSKYRLVKSTGDLFKTAMKECCINKGNVIHIGDNWKSDVENSSRSNMKSIFLPKAIEVFENKIEGITTNNCSIIGNLVTKKIQSKDSCLKSLGYRTMLAMVANKYFDNPYRTFNSESDFNIDPYLIGYYTIGMHMIGVCKWIEEETKNKEKIFFLSRDGYLPMKAFEIYQRNLHNHKQVEYLYTSRKALLPGMICNEVDFYDLPIEFHNHSPKSLINVLNFCSKEIEENILKEMINEAGFIYDKAFANEYEYDCFIQWFIKNIYSLDRLLEVREITKEYYQSKINPVTDIAFDMGYSGRIQGAISELIGQGVDVLFVHSDEKRSKLNSLKYNFKIRNFYDYTPNVSGLLREHLLSENGHSCIGFYRNNEIEPMFDNITKKYSDIIVTELLQQGALDFCETFTHIFDKYFDKINQRSQEVSLPFEGFLNLSKSIDRKVFSSSYFEDLVYGSREDINIYDYIQNYALNSDDNDIMEVNTFSEQLENRIKGKNRVAKIIIYFLVDKETLRVKMWHKLQGNKYIFFLGKKIYHKLLK